MSEKKYLLFLKTSIGLSLISVFFVFSHLIFPYITSKQLAFNIWIEFLAIIWVAFILKYPGYNPFKNRKNFVTYGLIAFFAVSLLTCFTGVDFNLSFWGDIERMLGWFQIVHFFLFYLIIITVFRDWNDWKYLFLFSILCATGVSLYGIINDKESTIGNTAYVSGYLIFNLYFAAILFSKTKNRLLRWLYLFPVFLMLVAFKKADTTGALVGLGASIIFLVYLFGMLAWNNKVKIVLLTLLAIILVGTGFLLVNRKSDWLKNNSLLEPISEISLQKNTFQTRLISWEAAFQDFHNHPWLGTGLGNYAITFDKYFKAKFYTYTSSETFFDRAHNNVVDLLSTTGVIGLAAYLLIFIAAIYLLIANYRRGKISKTDFVLVSSLILAYFIQNLAVFDSLVTYIYLMMTLGYIIWLSYGDQELDAQEKAWGNKEIAIFAIVSLGLLFSIYKYNIQVLRMMYGTINSEVASYQGDLVGAYEAEKQALSYNTGLDRDSRTAFIRKFYSYSGVTRLQKIDQTKAQEILNFSIDLAEKNVAYNPADCMMLENLAQIYNSASLFYQNDHAKFVKYSNLSVETMLKSINASPERTTLYFSLAQFYYQRGQSDKAVEVLKYAIGLEDKFSQGYCNLAQVYWATNKQEEGDQEMNSCLDLGGADFFVSTDFLNRLASLYEQKQDWAREIIIYQRLAIIDRGTQDNYRDWIALAKLYKQTNNKAEAIAAAQKAGELNSSIQNEVNAFIESLK